MPEPIPALTIPDSTLCRRCGGALQAGGAGAVTCPGCLATDLARDLPEWLTLMDVPRVHGLRATGGFTLLEEIGHGGMGQVFRARQHSPEREVAVKLLMPHLSGSAETRRRFLAESEAMAGLEHPGLLPLYACGETDGRPWLVTRLAGGGNLAQRRENYAGRWLEIAELTAGLADAIQHAHARGIIHRDLKPSNILFDSEGGACIADFGLAKWRDENAGGQTLTEHVLGTPAYMAPELARLGARAATTAADVYGLGAILYELLTGRPPHTGGSPAELLFKLTSEEPPRPRSLQPGIPRDLEVTCLRALAREPAGRYETAAALAGDLRRFVAGEPVSARPYSLPERALRWARRRPLAAGLTATLVAVLAVSAGIIVGQNADLRRTNAGWRAAGDDAEALVAYAVERLPDKLAPMGKLGLLDDLFAQIAAHYQRARSAPVSDRSAAEVREADFLVQWARVLRPQGRIAEADERLNEAESIAASATARPEAPAKAWAVLVQARQLSGLLALRKGRTLDARQLFTQAIATADTSLERFPALPELLVARAEAMTERCSALIAGEGGEPAALDELEAAWQAAVAASAKTATAERQQELLRALVKVDFYRGAAAGSRRDWPAAERHHRAQLAGHERLARLPAAGDEDQRDIANACNRIVRAMQGDEAKVPEGDRFPEMMDLIARQRSRMEPLLQGDPTNLRWKADAALMRLQEAQLAIAVGDRGRAIVVLEEAVGMIQDVPDEVGSTLEDGRSRLVNGLTRQLALRAGELSQAAKSAPEAEAGAARQAACDAAEAAFVAAIKAFPAARNRTPQNCIEACRGIWGKHARAGYARSRLERALSDPGLPAGLAEFLQGQLTKLDAAPAAPPASRPEKTDPDCP